MYKLFNMSQRFNDYTLINNINTNFDCCTDAKNTSKVIFYYGKQPPVKQHGYVRVVVMGNTFGKPLGDVPSGDIFIHSGNFSLNGCGIGEFIDEISTLPHMYKIIAGGLHENLYVKRAFIDLVDNCNIIFLDGATTLLCGLRIFSTCMLGARCMIYKRSYAYNDITITHVPPKDILDNDNDDHVGNAEVNLDIKNYPPAVCIVGAASEGHGALNKHNTLFINSNIYTFAGAKFGLPLVFDILPSLPIDESKETSAPSS